MSTTAIRVKNESQPARVAGAIAHAVREREFRRELNLEVTAIGQQAVYVAIKALARAQGYLAAERPDLYLGFCAGTRQVTPGEALAEAHQVRYVFRLGWLEGL